MDETAVTVLLFLSVDTTVVVCLTWQYVINIIIIIIMNFTAKIDSEKQWWWITDRMLADRLLLYV